MKSPKQNAGAETWNYYAARVDNAAATILLQSLADLIRYARQHQIRTVFLLEDDAGNNQERFALFYNGSFILHATEGYRSLEDYLAAAANSFPDAASFYKAGDEGYYTYDDYRLVREIGVPDAAAFDLVTDGGYVAGYQQYSQQRANGWPDIGDIPHAYALYTYGAQNGFADYAALAAALSAGFTTATLYEAATGNGFPDKATYDDAINRGLLNYEDYQFAAKYQLRDAADGLRFVAIDASGEADTLHDEKLLLSLLSRVEEGKRISINKLAELLRKSLEEYRYEDTGELPAWFRTALVDNEALKKFLAQAEPVKQYGHWDTDGEFFEIARLQERKVVIDGSNVAYNTQHGKETKPQAANILRLINFLKEKGFEEITVIADASLRHRLADPENIDAVAAAAHYLQAPAETAADAYLINYVKVHRCLIITNDAFRDWKIKDAWVAAHIDYYRLTFLIKEEEVLMPDLK